MTFTVSDNLGKLIELKMKDGKFSTVDELLAASLLALDTDEGDPADLGDFEPGELDRLLDEGLKSGPPIPGEVVHARIDAIIEAAKRREAERAQAATTHSPAK
jgi:Arc/MetJ-type ribon-helix-helix transcriptional regulator